MSRRGEAFRADVLGLLRPSKPKTALMTVGRAFTTRAEQARVYELGRKASLSICDEERPTP